MPIHQPNERYVYLNTTLVSVHEYIIVDCCEGNIYLNTTLVSVHA